MNKYLKRKYRELKMYVKNGWWGYARPTATAGRRVLTPSGKVLLCHPTVGTMYCCNYAPAGVGLARRGRGTQQRRAVL